MHINLIPMVYAVRKLPRLGRALPQSFRLLRVWRGPCFVAAVLPFEPRLRTRFSRPASHPTSSPLLDSATSHGSSLPPWRHEDLTFTFGCPQDSLIPLFLDGEPSAPCSLPIHATYSLFWRPLAKYRSFRQLTYFYSSLFCIREISEINY